MSTNVRRQTLSDSIRAKVLDEETKKLYMAMNGETSTSSNSIRAKALLDEKTQRVLFSSASYLAVHDRYAGNYPTREEAQCLPWPAYGAYMSFITELQMSYIEVESKREYAQQVWARCVERTL